MKSNELKIFIAHEIKSSHHKPNEIKKLKENIIKILDTKKFKARIETGEISPGSETFDAVMKNITQSDCLIAEISNNNPNVMIEAGAAYGRKIPVILIKNSESGTETPSNIDSIIRIEYNKKIARALSSVLVAREVGDAIHKALIKSETPAHNLRKIWGLKPSRKTYIIPGSIPDTQNQAAWEDYIHLRDFTDLDAILNISLTISNIYPGMEIRIISSNERLPQDINLANVISIGGPDLNLFAKAHQHKIPFKYKYNGLDLDEAIKIRDQLTPAQREKNASTMKITFLDVANNKAIETKTRQDSITDHGFFCRLAESSKNDSGARVFIGGLRTRGVYGAAMMASWKGLFGESSADKIINDAILHVDRSRSFLIHVTAEAAKSNTHPPQPEVCRYISFDVNEEY